MSAFLCLTAAVFAFPLAELLDAPWLRIVGLVLIVEAVVAKEAWIWWGEWREWLLWHGMLIVVPIAVAAIAYLTAG
jgi:hypothetical protein